MKKLISAGIVGAGLLIAPAFASGFHIYLGSANATAAGAGAYVAQVNDASALFYNPAGLGFMSGQGELQMGSSLIIPMAEFTGGTYSASGTVVNEGTYKMRDHIFNVPNSYFAYRLNENMVAGVSVTAPYGLTTDWESDWPGRYQAIRTTIKTVFLSPTIAWKTSDALSIGLQLHYVDASVNMFRKAAISPGDEDFTTTLKGAGDGIGWTLGLQYRPTDSFQLGLVYKSEVDIEFDGTVDFDNVADPFRPVFYDGDITADLTLPAQAILGMGFQLSEQWHMEIDLEWLMWSSYDRLIASRDADQITDAQAARGVLLDEVKDWEDVFAVRVGFTRYGDHGNIRFGFGYDEAPNPDEHLDPLLPDANRLLLTAGYETKFWIGTLQLAYELELLDTRDVTELEIGSISGSYDNTVHILQFSYSMKF